MGPLKFSRDRRGARTAQWHRGDFKGTNDDRILEAHTLHTGDVEVR
ncbi:MAG: hypothetical protein L7F78_16760 [Syntrophales bacterium LBB04]|nr:hypothetical protein [Syntrophales bacterium LBB04]